MTQNNELDTLRADLASERELSRALRSALAELLPMASEALKHGPFGWGQIAIENAQAVLKGAA